MTSVSGLLAQLTADLTNVDPDFGSGRTGYYPPSGDYMAELVGVEVEAADFTWKNPSPGKLQGIVGRFRYNILAGQIPDEADDKVAVGDDFKVPVGNPALPENQATRVRIENSRIKAFGVTILGADCPGTSGDILGAVIARVDAAKSGGGVGPMLRVRFSWREGVTKDGKKGSYVDKEKCLGAA